jgi:hypothetical protein
MIFLKMLVFDVLQRCDPLLEYKQIRCYYKTSLLLNFIGHLADDRFFCCLIIKRVILCDGIR